MTPEEVHDADAADGRPPSGGPGRWSRPGCVTIRCREHGPFVIELPEAGTAPVPEVRVIDHEGGEFPLPTGKRAVALCRCGHSAGRPFCDGSHRQTGFTAGERAAGPADG